MNIKIGEVVIENVNITDSGDLLGMNFMTTMRLAELEELFTPGSYPEFRVVDSNGEVVSVYKNRKQITLRVDNRDEANEVNLALQVTPAKIEEVELLTNQVNEQNAAIEAQSVANEQQAVQIAEQAAVIEAQADEIETLKSTLSDTQADLGNTKTELANTQTELVEAQEANNMLMECVLEMSEVVYA